MKNYFFAFASFCLFMCACSSAKMSSDELGKEEKMRTLTQSKQFVFNATDVNPQRVNILNIMPNGNLLRHLTQGYFLKLMNDSLSVYLPYFGRAYSAPYSTTDNGITVNTKDFSYSLKQRKKGTFLVQVNLHNDKTTQYFLLNVTSGGYATLQVQSINRDPISFYGRVEPLQNDIR